MNYCKLYIDTSFDMAEMEEIFALGFKEHMNVPGVEYALFVNDNYIEGVGINSPTYPVDRSRYYVEIDSDSDDLDHQDDFKKFLSELVVWLRLRCDFVVASCDFEDYIAEVTGWNWTPGQPLPPDAKLRDL